jgi:hypothetical protein
MSGPTTLKNIIWGVIEKKFEFVNEQESLGITKQKSKRYTEISTGH